MTHSDIITFFSQMILRSLIITVISFIPLFYLGIWKRATVPTVICAIVVMQSSYLAPMFNLNLNLVLVMLCVLGSLSIFLSIKTAVNIGRYNLLKWLYLNQIVWRDYFDYLICYARYTGCIIFKCWHTENIGRSTAGWHI